MAKYNVNGRWYTPNELSEISGIAAHTIRDRLRRGYSVEEAIKSTPLQDSIKAFSEASAWEDWVGMTISYLYEIYWKWCVSNEYQPSTKQGFSRQLVSIYPMLKIIPNRYGDKSCRVIRLRG